MMSRERYLKRLKEQRRAEMKLNAQELATILAALRVFQREVGGFDVRDIKRYWWEHFRDVQPLTSGQIDSLCERLNTEGLNV
jgi:hypothetical protein